MNGQYTYTYTFIYSPLASIQHSDVLAFAEPFVSISVYMCAWIELIGPPNVYKDSL